MYISKYSHYNFWTYYAGYPHCQETPPSTTLEFMVTFGFVGTWNWPMPATWTPPNLHPRPKWAPEVKPPKTALTFCGIVYLRLFQHTFGTHPTQTCCSAVTFLEFSPEFLDSDTSPFFRFLGFQWVYFNGNRLQKGYHKEP